MDSPWIEKALICSYRYEHVDGTSSRLLTILGIPLIRRRDPEIKAYSGFRLSLYDYSSIQFNDDMKSIPLLRYFIGEHIDGEVTVTEERQDVFVMGKRYTIMPVWRYTAYEKLTSFHKGRRRKVYHISSPDDNELPPFTFASKEWDARRPTHNEIINFAHELYREISGI